MEVTCDQAMSLIAALAEGELADSKSQTLQVHLDSCQPCSETLSALTGEEDADQEDDLDHEWIARFPAAAVAPSTLSSTEHVTAMDATMPAPAAATTAANVARTLPEINPAVYQREYAVGAGGAGQITRARDRRLGRVVALKEQLHDHGIDRFVHEAHVTARLQHPAIVPVHEAGQWPSGKPFFAMKLIEGRSLAKEIRRRDTLDARMELLPNMITMADAIAYAHSQGVVHRDLKPLNVMVGPYGETVVIDWGLAKFIDEDDDSFSDRSVRTSEVRDGATLFGVGTPHYMPKEQGLGEEPDERTDVYALGATLYHILAGHPPHWQPQDDQLPAEQMAQRITDIRTKVTTEPPQPLSEVVPLAPRDLLAIVARAMKFEPADRYPSAKEFAEDLRRFQTGQLVASYSYSRFDRLRRWLKRHQGVVTVSAIALLVLAVVGVLSIREIVHQRDSARIALVQVKKARTIADERAEKLLISSARSALSTDPTATLAWLKRYNWSSSQASAARVIAADAASRGVATFAVRAHDRRVTALAIDATAGTVVTASEDHTVRVWNIRAGTSTTLANHIDVVHDVATSADGTVVVSAGQGGSVFVRRGANNTPQKVATHKGGATTVDVRAKAIASGGADGRVILIDPDNSTRVVFTHTTAITRVRFSPDGKTVLAVAQDNSVHLLPIAAGIVWTLKTTHQNAAAPVFSRDGSTLVTVDDDNSIRVWSLAEHTSITVTHHKEAVSGLVVSANGKTIWSSSWDGDLRRLDVASKQSEVVLHSADSLLSLSAAADGTIVAAGGADANIHVYDSQRQTVQTLRGHRSELVSVKLSANGRRLVSVSKDGGLRVWRVVAQDQQRKLGGHVRAVRRVTFSSDGRLLLTASMSKFVLHDLTANTSKSFSGGEGYAGAFSPDSAQFALATDAGNIQLIDTTSKKVTRQLKVADVVRSLAFSTKGDLLAVGGDRGMVHIFRLRDQQTNPIVLTGHKGTVQWVAFSPDGATLATAGDDRSIRTWDVRSGKAKASHTTHTRDALMVSFSRDGRHVLSSGRDAQPRLWAHASTTAPRALQGHTSDATYAVFVPNSDHVISASADSTARMWSADGTSIRVFRGHTGALTHVAVGASGDNIVTTSQDHTIRLWDAATGESRLLPHNATQPFNHAVLSPIGGHIAAGSEDGSVWLWRSTLPDNAHMKRWLDEQTSVVVDPATGTID